jgi:FAD/FMN-containing dehydrogenase
MLLGVESYQSVQNIFLRAKEHLSEILSGMLLTIMAAYEFWDQEAFSVVLKHSHGTRDPFNRRFPFYVLIETHGSKQEHDAEKLTHLLENIMDNSLIGDGVLAQDTTQIAAFWGLRERIPEGCSKIGAVYKYDLSMPVEKMYSLVEIFRNKLKDAPSIRNIVGFGHLGDGNLHIGICADEFHPDTTKMIEPFVYEWTGSFIH